MMEVGDGEFTALDKVIHDIKYLEKRLEDLKTENEFLRNNAKCLKEQKQVIQNREKSLNEDMSEMRDVVEQFQSLLAQRRDNIGEMRAMKEELTNLKTSIAQKDEAFNKLQLESEERIKSLITDHELEMANTKKQLKLGWSSEVEALQTVITQKTSEIEEQQKEFAEAERRRTDDIVRLRIEYDTKLTKYIRQIDLKRKRLGQPTAHLADIFRKKLDNCKEEMSKENENLRSRAEQLQEQLIKVGRKSLSRRSSGR